MDYYATDHAPGRRMEEREVRGKERKEE